MNKELAESISVLALRIGADMDKQLARIKERCSEEEFKKYQFATGKVMAELLIGFMNPIYKEHPDLMPKEMGGEYEIDPAIYK